MSAPCRRASAIWYFAEDELLAEDGGPVGESVDGLAGEAHVEQRTLEPGRLGEDGDDGRAGLRVQERLLCGVDGHGDLALGWARALDLGHEAEGRAAAARRRRGVSLQTRNERDGAGCKAHSKVSVELFRARAGAWLARVRHLAGAEHRFSGG